jgi:hypothetical protein
LFSKKSLVFEIDYFFKKSDTGSGYKNDCFDPGSDPAQHLEELACPETTTGKNEKSGTLQA